MSEEKNNEILKIELLESQIHDVVKEFESLKHLNLEYLKTNDRLNHEIKNLKSLHEQQIILNDSMIDKNKEIFKGSKRNLFWLVSILCLAAILLSFQLIDKRINDKVLSKTNEAISKINHNLETSSKSLTISKNVQLEVQSFVNKYNLIQKQKEAELKSAQTQFQNILTNFKENTSRTNEAINAIKTDYQATLDNFKGLMTQQEQESKTFKVGFIKELTKLSQNNNESNTLKNQYQKELDSLNKKYKDELIEIEKIKKEMVKNSIVKKTVPPQKTVTDTSNKTADSLLQEAFKLQKKYYYTQAIKTYNEVIKLDSTKDIAHYNLGILYANKKQYEKAINAYKKSIELNPDRSLSFTNLFEMQLIMNKDFDSHTLKTYKDQNKENKISLIKYEMLDIFKDIKNQKNIDKKIHAWNENYKDTSFGKWSFSLLKNWIADEKDSTIKDNLTLVLKIFEEHQ